MSTANFFHSYRKSASLPQVILYLSMVLSLSGFRGMQDAPKTTPRSAAGQPATALVELFTSEGCSSCPAAEELLPAFRQQNVYVLELHVDYWDRLGWKDPFSAESFSNRQRNYARHFRLSSIYTPQAVVNGSFEFVDSDQGQIRQAIGKVIQKGGKENGATLHLAAKATGEEVTVTFNAGGDMHTGKTNPGVVNLALVQREAISKIGAGENSGRTLRHVNVVRALVTSGSGSGTTVFRLPATLRPQDVNITGWIQDADNGPVQAVATTDIEK